MSDDCFDLARALVKAAKVYHDEIADCTCADGDWECWYHLSDEDQACLSVDYALRTTMPSANNPYDVEALARALRDSPNGPWLTLPGPTDLSVPLAISALRWMAER